MVSVPLGVLSGGGGGGAEDDDGGGDGGDGCGDCMSGDNIPVLSGVSRLWLAFHCRWWGCYSVGDAGGGWGGDCMNGDYYRW